MELKERSLYSLLSTSTTVSQARAIEHMFRRIYQLSLLSFSHLESYSRLARETGVRATTRLARRYQFVELQYLLQYDVVCSCMGYCKWD
jgi:hypothetical protein